ncbi:MAG TPA: HAMP domain-containing sensor histidine kinase, partial [Longimicrobiales bacterium]|nr:HAMP domain-containing sensor histidine kinase [Longimicrobiales bacterium]
STVSEIRDGGVNATKPALSQSQIAASRYFLVSRLADDLAHEIKNPLHALVINVEVLKRRVERGATEPALERVSVIEHEVQRLNGLVDALLRLVRPEKAEGPISFGELWSQIGLLVALRAKQARIDFTEEGLPEDTYIAITPDVARFALLAVTEHALALARAEEQPIRVSGAAHEHEIEIHVWTGACATQSELAGDFEGAGLAAQMLEPLGGAVEIQKPGAGKGTTLVVRIPRANYT